MLLHRHDITGHLEGTKLCPHEVITINVLETVNPEYNNWFCQDKLIQNALMVSVDAIVASTVAYVLTFKHALDQFHTSFENKSKTRIFSLCHHLNQVNKYHKSIISYTIYLYKRES